MARRACRISLGKKQRTAPWWKTTPWKDKLVVTNYSGWPAGKARKEENSRKTWKKKVDEKRGQWIGRPPGQ